VVLCRMSRIPRHGGWGMVQNWEESGTAASSPNVGCLVEKYGFALSSENGFVMISFLLSRMSSKKGWFSRVFGARFVMISLFRSSSRGQK